MRPNRLHFIAVLSVLSLAAQHGPFLFGLTCGPGLVTTEQRAAAAEVVFVGRVVRVTVSDASERQRHPGAAKPRTEVEFEVRLGWKGVRQSRLVTSEHPFMDTGVKVGGEYLVFGHRSALDQRPEIRGCGDTLVYDQSKQVVHELGAPEFVSESGTS